MNDSKATVFVFLPFRLDPARRMLTRDGQPITLKPKELDTLLVLVEEDGRVVDKDDLIARIWHDSFVGDGSLAKNISVLRKALGEDVIETHRGRGYRITVPIHVEPSAVSAVTSHDTQPDAVKPASGIRTTSFFRRRLPIAIFAAAAFVAVTVFLVRSFSVRGAQAHSSTGGTPIHSILIQKNGALDPLDEGFKLARPEGNYPHAIYNRETNGWDRWRMVTGDQNHYFRVLSTEEKDFALARNWRLTCVCAVESGANFSGIDFAGEGARFDIELLQEGDRYFVGLTKQISPQFEFQSKIEFPGVADVAHPHTFELRYDHVSRTASLWIDDKQMASGYEGYYQFQEDFGLAFGAEIYGDARTGSAVFRQVRFEAQ